VESHRQGHAEAVQVGSRSPRSAALLNSLSTTSDGTNGKTLGNESGDPGDVERMATDQEKVAGLLFTEGELEPLP